MSIDITLNLKIEYRRCFECGTVWYIEGLRGSVQNCPNCSHKRASELQQRLQELERRNNALRGALTKARRVTSTR